MRVYALIPVQETFHVDLIADLKSLYCFVYVSIFIAEIGLNGKGVGLAIVGNVEVQIVSLASGTVVVVQERNVVSVCILASCLNGHSFEGNQLVLMVDELVFSQKVCYIQRFCDVLAILNLEGLYISNLDLTGPLCFVSGYFDLGSRNEFLVLFLGACLLYTSDAADD